MNIWQIGVLATLIIETVLALILLRPIIREGRTVRRHLKRWQIAALYALPFVVLWPAALGVMLWAGGFWG